MCLLYVSSLEVPDHGLQTNIPFSGNAKEKAEGGLEWKESIYPPCANLQEKVAKVFKAC